ncbi:crossover junction endodeoxyribonuclease RuvC [Dehalogenimonas formicexedens]|uniref:Crossover junction endodeoxyribonuclease RuvC n=1 Tax=Dehalogenimonas formicexedens TaxID=1839801 RepID=A0A1P8F7R8_9CHLR|nr:crossover junction endodeoxyribonuclease RuvC [Dehalogenimonas formicexedens]APV44485.1 crossover junction endodeoxyribonuclease RuvC [Dehalogenimonas formicexedens]
MRIIGIDPGTRCLGYGIIDTSGSEAVYVSAGAVTCSDKLPMTGRLVRLYAELSRIIAETRPDCAAVETPFFSENARSALAVGKAQAVAILAAANAGLPVFEYPPAKIKAHISGFGASDKDQVSRMVVLQLGLSQAPSPADASDALACALCHLQEMQTSAVINRNSNP